MECRVKYQPESSFYSDRGTAKRERAFKKRTKKIMNVMGRESQSPETDYESFPLRHIVRPSRTYGKHNSRVERKKGVVSAIESEQQTIKTNAAGASSRDDNHGDTVPFKTGTKPKSSQTEKRARHELRLSSLQEEQEPLSKRTRIDRTLQEVTASTKPSTDSSKRSSDKISARATSQSKAKSQRISSGPTTIQTYHMKGQNRTDQLTSTVFRDNSNLPRRSPLTVDEPSAQKSSTLTRKQGLQRQQKLAVTVVSPKSSEKVISATFRQDPTYHRKRPKINVFKDPNLQETSTISVLKTGKRGSGRASVSEDGRVFNQVRATRSVHQGKQKKTPAKDVYEESSARRQSTYELSALRTNLPSLPSEFEEPAAAYRQGADEMMGPVDWVPPADYSSIQGNDDEIDSSIILEDHRHGETAFQDEVMDSYKSKPHRALLTQRRTISQYSVRRDKKSAKLSKALVILQRTSDDLPQDSGKPTASSSANIVPRFESARPPKKAAGRSRGLLPPRRPRPAVDAPSFSGGPNESEDDLAYLIRTTATYSSTSSCMSSQEHEEKSRYISKSKQRHRFVTRTRSERNNNNDDEDEAEWALSAQELRAQPETFHVGSRFGQGRGASKIERKKKRKRELEVLAWEDLPRWDGRGDELAIEP